MLRQIAAGQFREAIATVKRDIALPAVLGRICPAPCEKVCRRGDLDARRVDLPVEAAGGRRRSRLRRSVRAGVQAGHGQARGDHRRGPDGAVGRLLPAPIGPRLHALRRKPVARRPAARARPPTAELPRDVLQAEMAAITRLGVELETGTRIGPDAELADLRARFDAVLLACGATAHEQAAGWGLPVAQRGIEVKPRTFETDVPGVFAAGNAVRGKAHGDPQRGRRQGGGRGHRPVLVRPAGDRLGGAVQHEDRPHGRRRVGAVCGGGAVEHAAPKSRAARTRPPASRPPKASNRPPAACTAIAAACGRASCESTPRSTMPIPGDTRPSGERSSRMRSTPR